MWRCAGPESVCGVRRPDSLDATNWSGSQSAATRSKSRSHRLGQMGRDRRPREHQSSTNPGWRLQVSEGKTVNVCDYVPGADVRVSPRVSRPVSDFHSGLCRRVGASSTHGLACMKNRGRGVSRRVRNSPGYSNTTSCTAARNAIPPFRPSQPHETLRQPGIYGYPETSINSISRYRIVGEVSKAVTEEVLKIETFRCPVAGRVAG